MQSLIDSAFPERPSIRTSRKPVTEPTIRDPFKVVGEYVSSLMDRETVSPNPLGRRSILSNPDDDL